MRALPTLLTALVLAACGAAEQPPAVADAPAPAASISDFAGTWQTEAMVEGTAEPVRSTLMGGADGTDWTMAFEGRSPVPLTVSMAGDSLIMESAEYESVLRPGVMVHARIAGVLQDGVIVGAMTAYYRTAEGEQQVPGTVRSTRVQ
jgi:hypothetical protein